MIQERLETPIDHRGRPDTNIKLIKFYPHVKPDTDIKKPADKGKETDANGKKHLTYTQLTEIIEKAKKEYIADNAFSPSTARDLFKNSSDIAVFDDPRAKVLSRLSDEFGLTGEIEMIERQMSIAECLYLEEFGLDPLESRKEFNGIKNELDTLVTVYKQVYPRNTQLMNYNFSRYVQDCRIAVIRSKIAHSRHGLVANTSEEKKANRTRRDLLKEIEEVAVKNFTFAGTSHDDREKQLAHFMIFSTSYNLDRFSQFSPEIMSRIKEAKSGVLEIPIRTNKILAPFKKSS